MKAQKFGSILLDKQIVLNTSKKFCITDFCNDSDSSPERSNLYSVFHEGSEGHTFRQRSTKKFKSFLKVLFLCRNTSFLA